MFKQVVHNRNARTFYISEKCVKWAEKARALLVKHGLTDYSFCYNKRAAACGVCYYNRKTIELSVHLVERNTDAEILDTILHEIAHAIAFKLYGERGHGPYWRRVCVNVGAKPVRCAGLNVVMPRREPKYRAMCGGCLRSYFWHRMRRGGLYFCANCGAEKGKLVVRVMR
jgi:predicted SprT family Zn-dependent metalloprotease